MTINQLRYFCTAARCHSITGAAKLLFVTQPAVSLAIRELEKEFSLTLFSYAKNRMELTKEGEAFYEQAAALLRQSDDMQAHFQDRAQTRPTVRVGIPPMLSTVFFPALIDAFHEKHPDIWLELSEFGSVRACEMVQDERLDLGLVNMEHYSIDKFSSLVLANDKLVFCVEPAHHLAEETHLTLDKLEGEPLILFNHDSVQNQLLNQHFRTLGVSPRIILHCSQLVTTLNFLRSGKCGCFLFSSMLPYVPELKGIPVEPEIPMKIGLVWKKGKYISSYTQTLIRFCERYYKEHPLA